LPKQEPYKKSHFTDEYLVEVYKAVGGSITNMAKRLGVTRATIYNWLKDYPTLRAEIDYAMESQIDLAENRMMMLIKGIPKIDKNSKEVVGWVSKPCKDTIWRFLQSKAKDRGYSEVGTDEEVPESKIVFEKEIITKAQPKQAKSRAAAKTSPKRSSKGKNE